MPCAICTVNALEDVLTKRYYLSETLLRHLLRYFQDQGLLTRWLWRGGKEEAAEEGSGCQVAPGARDF